MSKLGKLIVYGSVNQVDNLEQKIKTLHPLTVKIYENLISYQTTPGDEGENSWLVEINRVNKIIKNYLFNKNLTDVIDEK